MSALTYMVACPDCGKQLHHLVATPDHAPWLCDAAQGGCGFAFWPTQLLPDARAAWRPTFRDHAGGPDGHRYITEMHARCVADRAVARQRGTSVLPEFIGLLTKAQLTSLVLLLTPRAALLEAAYTLLQEAKAALKAKTAEVA